MLSTLACLMCAVHCCVLASRWQRGAAEGGLAVCRGSTLQTLGNTKLCPYKAAIHPLPSSSLLPFPPLPLSFSPSLFLASCLSLSFSDLRDIYRELHAARAAYLIRTRPCQWLHPSTTVDTLFLLSFSLCVCVCPCVRKFT